MGGVLAAKLDVGGHSRVGGVYARVIDVQVPDNFAISSARRKMRGALPAVRTKVMGRFTEPRWARPRRTVAIGVAIGAGVGIAVVFISDLLRPLVERMRGAPG